MSVQWEQWESDLLERERELDEFRRADEEKASKFWVCILYFAMGTVMLVTAYKFWAMFH